MKSKITTDKPLVAGGSIQNPLVGQLFRSENGDFSEIVNRTKDLVFFRASQSDAEKTFSTGEWFAWCTWNNVKPATTQDVELYLSADELDS